MADDDFGLQVDFRRQGGAYQVEQCARCHSRRERVSAEDAHGRRFLDDFLPATLRAELYHADGQIDDEVYVYGSFAQSAMYAAGVRCSDCHDPHAPRFAAIEPAPPPVRPQYLAPHGEGTP